MKILISNRSSIPIYEQIKEQIIALIADGHLNPHDKLPSIRSLAKDLKISVITTTRAYSDLEDEGYIVGVQGKGYFVLEKSQELNYEAMMVQVEEHILELIKLKEQLEL